MSTECSPFSSWAQLDFKNGKFEGNGEYFYMKGNISASGKISGWATAQWGVTEMVGEIIDWNNLTARGHVDIGGGINCAGVWAMKKD